MREGVGIHSPSTHALQTVVANGGGGVHGLLYIAGFEDMALICGMSPNTRQAVGLKLEPNR